MVYTLIGLITTAITAVYMAKNTEKIGLTLEDNMQRFLIAGVITLLSIFAGMFWPITLLMVIVLKAL